jgi:hypothetical protein
MCFTGYTSEEEEAVGLVHHRHQSNVWDGMNSRLSDAMDKFSVFKSYQDSFYNRLKETPLTDAEAHDLIIKSVRSEAITAKDCFNVAEEWAFQNEGPKSDGIGNSHREMPGAYLMLIRKSIRVFKTRTLSMQISVQLK